MRIDEYRFRGAVKVHTQTAIAKHLGIKQPSLYRKLQRLDRLRISEFNAICEAMDEKPESFIIFDEPQKAA
jgi:DNA-binding Xre family transcriptional regulator